MIVQLLSRLVRWLIPCFVLFSNIFNFFFFSSDWSTSICSFTLWDPIKTLVLSLFVDNSSKNMSVSQPLIYLNCVVWIVQVKVFKSSSHHLHHFRLSQSYGEVQLKMFGVFWTSVSRKKSDILAWPYSIAAIIECLLFFFAGDGWCCKSSFGFRSQLFSPASSSLPDVCESYLWLSQRIFPQPHVVNCAQR